ncbi:MAG: acyl carrier protein [Rhodospirillales bacterium]|jgi:acyl carrier protein
MDDSESWVIAYLSARLLCDPNLILPTAVLTDDLGADSLDTIEMLMDAESAFGVHFTDDQAEAIVTVDDAIACIRTARGCPSPAPVARSATT